MTIKFDSHNGSRLQARKIVKLNVECLKIRLNLLDERVKILSRQKNRTMKI